MKPSVQGAGLQTQNLSVKETEPKVPEFLADLYYAR